MAEKALISESRSVLCMACDDATCNFKATQLQRRAPGDYDVVIKMHFCGVCHSDIHAAAGHLEMLGKNEYPMVPGHELAGVVSEVGSKVSKFKVGMKIGVGTCMSAMMLTRFNMKRYI